MLLVSSCSCLCPIHWSRVKSRELRCGWSSNYIWPTILLPAEVCLILELGGYKHQCLCATCVQYSTYHFSKLYMYHWDTSATPMELKEIWKVWENESFETAPGKTNWWLKRQRARQHENLQAFAKMKYGYNNHISYQQMQAEIHTTYAGIIFCRRPANERRRNIVTSSLIGWMHTYMILVYAQEFNHSYLHFNHKC